MPTSASNPRQRATATITTANASGERDQRPAAFEVVERVGCGALCVDRPDDPDVITRRKLRLAGAGGELEQRVGAGVRSGIDRDQRQHAPSGARGCRERRGGKHLTGRRAAAVAQSAGQHVAALRCSPRRRPRSGTASGCRRAAGLATTTPHRLLRPHRSRPAARRRSWRAADPGRTRPRRQAVRVRV